MNNNSRLGATPSGATRRSQTYSQSVNEDIAKHKERAKRSSNIAKFHEDKHKAFEKEKHDMEAKIAAHNACMGALNLDEDELNHLISEERSFNTDEIEIKALKAQVSSLEWKNDELETRIIALDDERALLKMKYDLLKMDLAMARDGSRTG